MCKFVTQPNNMFVVIELFVVDVCSFWGKETKSCHHYFQERFCYCTILSLHKKAAAITNFPDQTNPKDWKLEINKIKRKKKKTEALV